MTYSRRLVYILLGLAIGLFTFAPFASPHGLHSPLSNLKHQFVLGQGPMDRCTSILYIDTNNNGKVDWVRIISLCGDHGPHYIFDDTYPKFLKEFGEYWRLKPR